MIDDTDDERGADESSAGMIYEIDAEMRPSEAVVRAVATVTDATILELEPLYDVIDPARLDGVVDIGDLDGVIDVDEPDGGRSVSFRYEGCRVRVTPDAVYVRVVDD